MMEMSPERREQVIRDLRVEAIAVARQLGCTCEPEPECKLTEYGLGPYDLPAWMTNHADECPLAEATEELKRVTGDEMPVIFMRGRERERWEN